MRPPRKLYLYHHKEYIELAPSLVKAAEITNTDQTTIRMVLNGKYPCTKDGWYFSDTKLTDDELKNIQDSNIEKTNKRKIQIYKKETRTYVPDNRKDRIKQLRKLIFFKLQDRWMTLPKQMAILEKTAFNELLDSLE